MVKLNTMQASQTHRILIFGPPKSGKTKLAGSLAEFYDLLWFDLENGYETLFQLPEEWQKRIDLIPLQDTRSYPIGIETCLKVVKGAKTSICNEHGKVGCMVCKRELVAAEKGIEEEGVCLHDNYFIDVELNSLNHNNIVVFDSLTQLTNSAIAHITKSEPDSYKLTYDDWGNLGKLMDIFLSHIQQAGYNVIVISHEVEAETEGKKKKLVPVAGTRNFSRNAPKYFDHVIYTEVKNCKHTIGSATTYNPSILTGSRTDVSLENVGEGSLLPIFKPELYPEPNPSAKPSIKTSGKQASDILARLKAKQK